MAFIGILSFGGVFAGVNPSHTPYELTHAFKTAQVKALIVEPELLPNALKAAAQAGIPRSHIFIFDHHTPVTKSWHPSEVWGEGLGGEERWGGCRSWRYLMTQGEDDWARWNDEKRSKETVAARLFSSGTTGLPKAVEMTHYNFIAQHTMVLEWKPRDYDVSQNHSQLTLGNFPFIHCRLYDCSAPQCSTSATCRAPTPVLFAAA
jgi:4-coumarate--CoA ligase